MTIAGTPYPSPVYSLRNATTSQNGAAIDIGACTQALVPPVLVLTITATASCTIEGSHDGVDWSPCGSAITANAMKDLVIGVRFWRVTAGSIGSGTVTASVGAVPDRNGRLVVPNLYTLSNVPGASL